MKVLVTGASGFIGGWVARELCARGDEVRAVYRRSSSPPHLERLKAAGAELRRLELASPEEAAAAVAGVDAVVHAAARTGDWGPAEAFYEQNVAVTRNVLEAARASSCRAFVYLGSTAVHGFGPHVDTTEEGPYYPHVHPYQVTKKMAEELVLARNAPGFRTTTVRPGTVYGPGDTTTFYPLLDAQKRGVKGTVGGGRSLTCPVYVEDLVRALLLALGTERSAGEVFNVTGGERVTWRELLDYTAELLGVRPVIDPPLPVARALAYLLGGLFAALRIPTTATAPPLTRYRIEQVTQDYHFSIAKASRLLGYVPRVAWREGLRRTVEAYRAREPA